MEGDYSVKFELCADTLSGPSRALGVRPGISSPHNLEVRNCEMDEGDTLLMLQTCRDLLNFTFSSDASSVLHLTHNQELIETVREQPL